MDLCTGFCHGPYPGSTPTQWQSREHQQSYILGTVGLGWVTGDWKLRTASSGARAGPGHFPHPCARSAVSQASWRMENDVEADRARQSIKYAPWITGSFTVWRKAGELRCWQWGVTLYPVWTRACAHGLPPRPLAHTRTQCPAMRSEEPPRRGRHPSLQPAHQFL